MKQEEQVIFREVQRSPIWVWILILGIAILMWYGFIQQIILDIPFGDKPAPNGVLIVMWLFFGIAFPVLMLGVLKLIIEVREKGLYVRFVPFHFQYKQYLFKNINHYECITYSPLKRFGGWGIRFNLKNEKAYNINGNKGIELKLQYNTVVIGTQKSDELKKALYSVQKYNEN
ncbi:TPA: hypothetical protein QC285_003101 [Bacillus cereus]|uniref:DUF6141 family protein n=1 Tax=Bacillus cereus group TaxID=86661 RepID=UPI000BEDD08D|nr:MULTISPECIES: DUF6141 family protein [Bacillus cereus group]MEB9948191.1 DUF6141 family protein [Bacillus cereus]PDZ57885.1 hypothetical protein CON15_09905 [Bacillus cereus]PEQ37228.1 hypothetical protein CN466_12430 [Bacillus cereus]PEQ89477.1 hypothetical protein CN482_06295 [Bacillus cereus]PEU03159.1 hypothetical protein CN531_28915 [Bacillus cereus]